MHYENDYEQLRPYNKAEVKQALKRIANDPTLEAVVDRVFPETSLEEIIIKINNISTTEEFQRELMHQAIRNIINTTSRGLSFDGLENLNPQKSNLFISNHRDIVLDPAILQVILFENNFKTSQITFGSNLMITPFITDVSKINKVLTVDRNSGSRESYNNSKRLSNYLRESITKNNESVWIAQKNGRTKDGDDKTQTGLLKMLNISGNNSFTNNFSDLNITPVSVSYEYEPCDHLKVQELYISTYSDYQKTPEDDFKSLISGIMEPKGRIHFTISKPISEELSEIEKIENENLRIRELANLIDDRILSSYKLWQTNFIATDLLNGNSEFSDQYSSEDKKKFVNYINNKLENLKGDHNILHEMFLSLYANPVLNCMEIAVK